MVQFTVNMIMINTDNLYTLYNAFGLRLIAAPPSNNKIYFEVIMFNHFILVTSRFLNASRSNRCGFLPHFAESFHNHLKLIDVVELRVADAGAVVPVVVEVHQGHSVWLDVVDQSGAAVPVEDVPVDESRAKSGWRPSNEITPSAVATLWTAAPPISP